MTHPGAGGTQSSGQRGLGTLKVEDTQVSGAPVPLLCLPSDTQISAPTPRPAPPQRSAGPSTPKAPTESLLPAAPSAEPHCQGSGRCEIGLISN